MKSLKSCGIIFFLFVPLFMFACDSGGGSSSSGSADLGTVSMSLTDAMSNEFNAVYVTIEDVQVHMKGNGNGNNNWESVSTPNLPKTFNLYDLTNGVREEIGIADLKTGPYTQMRLIIGTVPDDGINELSQAHPYANYVIDIDDDYQELKIPSGINTGIKIVHGFEISPNTTTELILDFNAEKSVIVAGDSGIWHLKPTIKCGTPEELSIIKGKVTTDGSKGIDKVLVSVQEYNETAEDDKNKVIIHTSTVTDPDGNFAIFVSPLENDDEYNLVIYEDGKVPEHEKISTLTAGQTLIIGTFQLEETVTKNVGGIVTITGGDNNEEFASISFRQDIDEDEMIEITSVDVLNTEDYIIELPIGTYSVVAWAPDSTTQTSTLVIDTTDESPIENHISLDPKN